MPTPILRQLVGVPVTGAGAIVSGGYSAAADKLTLDNASGAALLADFDLVAAFGVAPVTGAVQLMAVDWSLDGASAGPAPAASMMPRLVGAFSPQPQAGNASTTWRMRINAVALTRKTDFYLLNNGTAQQISAGWTLTAQPWTPGT